MRVPASFFPLMMVNVCKWWRAHVERFEILLANTNCSRTLQTVPIRTPEQGAAPPPFDMELLQQAGVAERLPEWRKLADAAQLNQIQLVG
jgi:hypothetical protein